MTVIMNLALGRQALTMRPALTGAGDKQPEPFGPDVRAVRLTC